MEQYKCRYLCKNMRNDNLSSEYWQSFSTEDCKVVITNEEINAEKMFKTFHADHLDVKLT